jgi:DNA-binding protein YbaB
MKSFETEIKKYAEKTHLKVSERRELRERIFAYMEYHPLPKQALDTTELAPKGILSESFVTFRLSPLHMRVMGGFFVLMLVVAPFVAERSVPGDVLYMVKTGVNETLQGQLANSPYEKIEFETRLMERRIGEARVLASEGKLTEEVKTHIAETVKEHTSAVQQGLAELRIDDADGAALAQITFNSSLEVQTAMIQATINDTATATDTAPMDSILLAVNDAHAQGVSDQNDDVPSYDGLLAQVERETTRAYELFTVAKESATEEEVLDINRRMDDINRLTLEAKERSVDNIDVSSNDLATTLGLVQKLIAFMTDIDIRNTVELESIVPVILSDEERVRIVKEEMVVLETTLKSEMTARLLMVTDQGIQEKASSGLTQIDEFLTKATIALEVADIGLAENSVKEARALMTDIDVMTQFVEEPTAPLDVVDGEVPVNEGLPGEDTSTSTPVATDEVAE